MAMIDLEAQVAKAGFKPQAWQVGAPTAAYNGKPPVQTSEDLRRILALPRRPPPDQAQLESLVAHATARYTKHNPACRCAAIVAARKAPPRPCIKVPRPAQSWALFEMERAGGLIGHISVGSGKSLLDILAPLAVPDCKTAVVLVPPQLVEQLVLDYQLVREHFHVPNMLAHGRHEWSSGGPNAYAPPLLHVFPYSLLSRPESTTILDHLAPDLIVADESHRLRHVDTATTSRVLRYFETHGSTRFCAWTGSLTESSIRDYAHHSALSLRYGSPLPLDPDVVDDWARAIDPDPNGWQAPPGALEELCVPGEHVEDGFRRRFIETPGVVRVETASADCEIVIDERPAPAIPDAVMAALDMLRETWQRPDGEELIDALAVARCARELAAGFYLRWRFPLVNGVAQREEDIRRWFDARQAWNKELRYKLKKREEHLDSEQLCQHAAERYHGDRMVNRGPDGRELPVWDSVHWPAWRDVKNTVVYESEAVRLDDYLARDAAAWALEHRGIVWYESTAFGEWVAEISGLPMHGGGPEAGKIIAKEKGDRSIIASIKSHGTGRDGLQRIFHENLFAQPMSSATTWEQGIGRTARDGQQSKTVHIWTYRHTEEFQDAVDKALARAIYIEKTLGAVQKLRLGWRIRT